MLIRSAIYANRQYLASYKKHHATRLSSNQKDGPEIKGSTKVVKFYHIEGSTTANGVMAS